MLLEKVCCRVLLAHSLLTRNHVAEVKAANAQTYAEGTVDRAKGKIDSVVGAVTGNDAQQASGTCFGRRVS